MRVCMLTTSYPRWPGDMAGLFVAELVLHLAKEQKIEVTVLAPADVGVSLHERKDKVEIHRVRYFWPWRFQRLAYGHGMPCNIKSNRVARLNIPFFLLAFAWKLCVYAYRADIIHAHWGGLGAVAVATRFIHRLPVVIMVRGTDLSTKNKLIRRVTEWAIKRADGVITNSPEYYRFICDLRQGQNGCHYVHNGVEYPSDHELAEFRAEYKRQNGNVNIISVARLIPERRYDILIRAFAKVHKQYAGTNLTLVGDGPERGFLESLVKDFGLDNSVEFVGMVLRDEVFRYLLAADIYISATTVETHGNSVSEAAACGLPIITTRVGFPAELVVNGETGFVIEPNDEQGLAQAMEKMLAAPDKRRSAGEAMRKRIKDLNLSWQTCAQHTIEIYNFCMTKE